MIFGAYDGQVYTAGNVVIIVANFPEFTCRLPDPTDIHPSCKPSMTVSLFTNGGACYNISAVSNRVLEFNFGFMFSDDPKLETDTGVYNHWSFPLYVLDGMATSRLEIKSVFIPPECNGQWATFDDSHQISNLRVLPNIKIDAMPPQIVSLHTGKSPGTYTNGTMINIVVEFSKDVSFSSLPDQYAQIYVDIYAPSKIPYGIPYLELNSNAFAPLRGYNSVRSKKTLSFLYKVGPGEETPLGMQLDIRFSSSIVTNGGYIVGEGTGVDVNLTSMPQPGEEGKHLTRIQIFRRNMCEKVWCGLAGSLSHPTANKIYIVKKGEKFPPLMYDAEVPPVYPIDSNALREDNSGPRRSARATKVMAVTDGCHFFLHRWKRSSIELTA